MIWGVPRGQEVVLGWLSNQVESIVSQMRVYQHDKPIDQVASELASLQVEDGSLARLQCVSGVTALLQTDTLAGLRLAEFLCKSDFFAIVPPDPTVSLVIQEFAMAEKRSEMLQLDR